MRFALITCAVLWPQLCAQGFDMGELYQRWQERERTHLLGRDVLDDVQLIEHLEPLAGLPNEEASTPPKDWRAAMLLGLGYLYGKAGAPRDAPTARRYLLRAMRASREAVYAAALGALSDELPAYNPWKGPRDPREFFTLGRAPSSLAKLAEQGPVPAQALYGQLTLMEKPGDKAALAHLAAAADAGCFPALVWHALQAANEDPANVDMAHKGLVSAAEAGFTPAFYALGALYDYRSGKAPNLAECRKWYQRAWDGGDYDALWALQDLPEKILEETNLDEIWQQYVAEPGDLTRPEVMEFRWVRTPSSALRRYPGLAVWLDARIAELPTPSETDPPTETCIRLHILRSEFSADGGQGFSEKHLSLVLWHSNRANVLWSDFDLPTLAQRKLDDFESEKDFWEYCDLLRNLRTAALDDAYRASDPEAQKRVYGAALQGFSWDRRRGWYQDARDALQRRPLPTEEAVSKLSALAVGGDRWCARFLANHFEPSTHPSKHLRWLGKAAELGDGNAHLELAQYFSLRDDVGRNAEQTRQHAASALRSRVSHAGAQALLARFDSSKESEARRKFALELSGEAERILNRDANLSAFLAARPRLSRETPPEAASLLGVCYFFGHGVLADRAKALELIRWGGGGAVALYVLARYYETAEPPDREGALLCYNGGTTGDVAFAKLGRGRYLRDGIATAKDAAKAAELFKESAEAGCLPAMVEYAKCLRDGAGVAADADAAKRWARKAADEGHEPARKLLDEWK